MKITLRPKSGPDIEVEAHAHPGELFFVTDNDWRDPPRAFRRQDFIRPGGERYSVWIESEDAPLIHRTE